MKRAQIIVTLVLLVVSGCLYCGGIAKGGEAAEARVLFIVDVSASMKEPLEGTTKLDVAKGALGSLLPGLDQKQGFGLGLMLFGHRTTRCSDIELAVEVGPDTANSIREKVQGLSPVGCTPLAASLKTAGAYLRSLTGLKRVILLTDGIETCGGNPIAVAASLVAEGIDLRIHVIGFSVRADAVGQLTAIAEAGKGTFQKADTADQLLKSFEEISKEIEKETLGEAVRMEAVVGDVYFEDDFSEEELGSAWKVIDEDPDRWVIDEGFFVVTQELREVERDGAKQVVYFNTLELQKPLPQSFEVTLEWEVGFQRGAYWGQEVLLGLASEKGDSVKAGFRHGTFAKAYTYLGRFFQKEVGGTKSEVLQLDLAERVPKRMDIQKVRARIVKKKFDFEAYAQVTGEDWKQIGTHKILKFAQPKLRICQYNMSNGFEGVAPEVEVRVKKVTIKEVE